MMSDLIWRFSFLIAVGSLIWVLHKFFGTYPSPLPKSKTPSKEILLALLLWGIAVTFPILMMDVIFPLLNRAVTNRTLNQLIQVPLRSVPYVLLPLILILRPRRWTASDLGLSLRNQSRSVTVFAVSVGLGSGIIAHLTGQSNLGIAALPAGELLLLFYNNAFLEEFYHRGIIQGLLERSAGQTMAIFWGGLLFGLTHVVFDINALLETGGILVVLSAILLQTMAGWLFGIIFMKTRSLWPGIICHYLANWLPSILALLH
jgi:membrane protease YdiL (CAAX protease family)